LAGLRQAFCGDILRRVPRRPVVLALTALAGVSLPSLAQAGTAQRTLAERYAPVVRSVKQTHQCGHGEPYVPTDVNLVLSNPGVALRGPWDKTNIVKVAPGAADLGRGLFGYHLDFPGSAVSPRCVYDEWSHRLNKGHPPTVYARVVTEAMHPGRLALQYWFFYVFNDFNDKHEGDWEMIQLDFDAGTAQQALGLKPALVGYSQHEGAESARWGDSKLKIVDGSNPVVYPALGSHANYYTSALHLGRSAAQGVGCDDTTSPSVEVRPDVRLIPTRRTAYLRAYPWLGYAGRWGEEHQGFYNGPTGPTTKLQWTKPITWANDEWRDRSFTVPAGGSVGSTATSFFCGAAATGSSLLTAIVGNPSPVMIALAVILLVLLWLISRTQWQPSAPLRLERRRTWGSIVTASRRMYFGHLRLFLAIGLLFFPVGIVITGIQYLLFRVSGLRALVDSAGSTNAAVDFLAISLGIVLTFLALAVVQSATALAIVEIDAGREPGARAAYKKVLPRLRTLLGGVLVAGVVIAIGALTAVGTLLAIWLFVRWAFLPQVVVLEGASARAALGRSTRLVRGSWWRVAALLLFVTVIALLLGPLCGTLLLFVTDASFDFINLVSSVIYCVVLPFTAIATTYLYFDQRVAKQYEGETTEADDVLPAETPPAVLAPH
jgi:hypothetical protein